MRYRKRISADAYHHKQQYRHDDARIAFYAFLHTFIYHIKAHYGKDSRIDNRRPQVRYEACEISVSYWCIGIFRYVCSEIFQHPATYHAIVGIDDIRHYE